MQIEGRNPVIEALKSGISISKIAIKESSQTDPKIAEIMELAGLKNIPVVVKSKKFLNKITKGSIHQGVIAFTKEVKQVSLEEVVNTLLDKNIEPFLVFIRDAQNESNIGAIIRTAEAAGANAVVLPPKISISAKIVHSSMGATVHIPVMNANLFPAIKYVQTKGIKVVGIEMNGTKNYFEEDLKGPVMLIIGGEDHSLSEEIQNKCDSVVKIPMIGKVNSLNMSVAAGLVIYEKVRQSL